MFFAEILLERLVDPVGFIFCLESAPLLDFGQKLVRIIVNQLIVVIEFKDLLGLIEVFLETLQLQAVFVDQEIFPDTAIDLRALLSLEVFHLFFVEFLACFGEDLLALAIIVELLFDNSAIAEFFPLLNIGKAFVIFELVHA